MYQLIKGHGIISNCTNLMSEISYSIIVKQKCLGELKQELMLLFICKVSYSFCFMINYSVSRELPEIKNYTFLYLLVIGYRPCN